MLARETGMDRHGIWVEGSYGTGKSRTIWTLQNLLTCSKEELNGYFDNFESLKKKADLRDKLLFHKEERLSLFLVMGAVRLKTSNSLSYLYMTVSRKH